MKKIWEHYDFGSSNFLKQVKNDATVGLRYVTNRKIYINMCAKKLEKKDKEERRKKTNRKKKIPTVKLEYLNGAWGLGVKFKIFKWKKFVSDKYKW